MRVISVKTLREYWQTHADVEQSLKAWYHEASRTVWQTPDDVKRHYPSADILPNNRVVFNIKGHHYHLIVQIHYNTGTVFIRFIGTHAEYDRIDATKI